MSVYQFPLLRTSTEHMRSWHNAYMSISASPRIVTTIPSATEIIYALGLGEHLYGVSHECNYPAAARSKPRITSVNFDYASATSKDIDSNVVQSLHEHRSLFTLDEHLLQHIEPTHLIIQRLCDVCAITPGDIHSSLIKLPSRPQIIDVMPRSIEDILTDIIRIGTCLDRSEVAASIVTRLQQKITEIKTVTSCLKPKKVFCVEWLDPLYASGHWVPEMINIAGGHDPLGSNNSSADKRSWEDVASADPDILVLIPCGFSYEKISAELHLLYQLPVWSELRAVCTNQVWIADGPSFFNQSGPRVISQGIPLLASIIHPEIFGTPTPSSASRWIR
jgi:iron complex transport system substrate-binding protein